MAIFITIYTLMLKLTYFLLKKIPTKKNKILFISRQSNNISLDYAMIIKEINRLYPNYQIHTITKKITKTKLSIIKNIPNIFNQMYHLASSSICIVDGYNIPVSVLNHKKDLKIIQIWHSLGAIKKFGYQSISTKNQQLVAQKLKMHKNYNRIISASSINTQFFMEAFGYEKKDFYINGLPRVDYLLTQKNRIRKKILQKYPMFKKKKTILYAPTFRDNENYQFNELISQIDLNKYNVIVKLHPNIKDKVNYKGIYTCNDFSTIDLLFITDYLLTDYSAISIEASILNIPIYIYAYDYDDYKKNPGLNINLYNEFPQHVYKNAKELVENINNSKYDISIVENYKNKYLKYIDANNTNRLVKFIVEGVE